LSDDGQTRNSGLAESHSLDGFSQRDMYQVSAMTRYAPLET
jgi:hypothetical protein